MQIKMQHDQHGFHIAQTPQEFDRCLKHGWRKVEEKREKLTVKKGDKCQSAPTQN